MTTLIVRYGEIALKGQNRTAFEGQLMANIRRVLGLARKQVRREHGQIVVEVHESQVEQSKRKLARLFGVAWLADAAVCPSSVETITEQASKVAAPLLNPQTSFAVDASRANKSLPFTSEMLNEVVGANIQGETAAPVDLDEPDVTVYISARKEQSYVFTKRIPGPGGLPVGTSEKVLSLISGGFDSVASSYLLAKRGASVDFLHFHVYPGKEGVFESKMPRLCAELSAYTLTDTAYLASYGPFQVGTLALSRRRQHYELVIFRRLMVRVGERLAEEHGYHALALGDSLGQVASQTMENIVAVDRAVDIPVFRPLIGMDKLEIVNLVTDIGLREGATARYKDCCSIISPSPITRAKLDEVERLEEALGIEDIIETMVESIEAVAVGSAGEVMAAA